MIVISNASPLIAISRMERLDLFQQLFQQIIIPPAVRQEMLEYCPDRRQKRQIEIALATFIEVRDPQVHHLFSRNIGKGECGVLNLALELSPDILFLDDRKARNEARERGLTPSFTTDLLKEAEYQGLIPSYRQFLQELYNQGVYLPE